MLVDHLVYYLIHQDGMQWRDDDWRSLGVVKCVKNEPYKGTFRVRLSGVVGSYSLATRDAFLAALWPHMAKKICTLVGGEKTSLVPIPNSDATIASELEYKTLNYARAIAAHSAGKLVAVDALRWQTAQDPQHKKGGVRDPSVRYANMRSVATPPAPAILLDDFFTSGASLIAAVWRLREVGVDPVRGFVIGRNTHIQQDEMTRWGSEELPIPIPPLL